MFLSSCEILTKSGWIRLPESSELREIENVMTFNPDNAVLTYEKFKYLTCKYDGEGFIIKNRLLNNIVPKSDAVFTNQNEIINCFAKFPMITIKKRGLTAFPISGYYEGSINETPDNAYLIGTILSTGKIIEDYIELYIKEAEVADIIAEVMESLKIVYEVNIDEYENIIIKIPNYMDIKIINDYFNPDLTPKLDIIEIIFPVRISIIKAIFDNSIITGDKNIHIKKYVYTNNDINTQEFIRILLTVSGYSSQYITKAYSGLSIGIKEEIFATVHHSNFEASIIPININETFIRGKNVFNSAVVKYNDKIFIAHTNS